MSEVPTCYKLEGGEGHHIMHIMLPWRLRKVAAHTPDLPAEAKAQYLLYSTTFSGQQNLAVESSLYV